MKFRCPTCGHTGSESMPHELFERWDEDDPGTLEAEGYDPFRTSAGWFTCGQCGRPAPFYTWSNESLEAFDSLDGMNIVHDDGATKMDWDEL